MIVLVTLIILFCLFAANKEAGIGIGIVAILVLIALYAYVPSVNILAF